MTRSSFQAQPLPAAGPLPGPVAGSPAEPPVPRAGGSLHPYTAQSVEFSATKRFLRLVFQTPMGVWRSLR